MFRDLDHIEKNKRPVKKIKDPSDIDGSFSQVPFRGDLEFPNNGREFNRLLAFNYTILDPDQ